MYGGEHHSEVIGTSSANTSGDGVKGQGKHVIKAIDRNIEDSATERASLKDSRQEKTQKTRIPRDSGVSRVEGVKVSDEVFEANGEITIRDASKNPGMDDAGKGSTEVKKGEQREKRDALEARGVFSIRPFSDLRIPN